MGRADGVQIIGYVAIIVIIISLFSLGASLTGRVTDTGQLNVTIENYANINFTTDFIDFGGGSVNAGQSYSELYTNGTIVNGNWTSPNTRFVIENIGNVNVTLRLATGKNADSYIGGTSPLYRYNITNISAAACPGGVAQGTWQDVNTTGQGTLICNPLQYYNDKDDIEIHIWLRVPSDAAGGTKTDTLTATATAA